MSVPERVLHDLKELLELAVLPLHVPVFPLWIIPYLMQAKQSLGLLLILVYNVSKAERGGI